MAQPTQAPATTATKTLPHTGRAPHPRDGADEFVPTTHTHHRKERFPQPIPLALPPRAITGTPPSVLRHHLTQALSWNAPILRPATFRFEWTDMAAAHNLAILATFDFDLGRAIAAQSGSIVSPGCDFWPTSLLQPLCGHHPLWPRAAEWLSSGVTFPSTVLPEADRLTDLKAMLVRGNHQSAKQRAPTLEKMMHAEVRHGWQLPLPPAAAL
jgi:hypothetical protein